MNVDVSGSDEYACNAYKLLFETIMNDVGKAILVDKASLVLKPEVPLFIFSVRLVNELVSKTISDAASVRQDKDIVHLCIDDEKFAPEILSQLWRRYGRDNVDQQTRFDLVVNGGKEDEIANMLISSGEESKKEIIGALWRAMPEGIKDRHNISDPNVITIVATEEMILPEMIEEGKKIHKSLGGVC